MVPFSFWRVLQSNSQNCEFLKYVWNVYCIIGITNHGQDLQPQKTKKHGTNLFNFKRAQNRSSISEYTINYRRFRSKKKFSEDIFRNLL